jgi:glycosyltransferase involved in cell wall biosynthesis
MDAGSCVLAYDAPENREVVGDAGMLFSSGEELSRLLQSAVDNPQLVESYRAKGKARAQAHYSWDAIADEYEQLFRELCG